jgi:hypothetical protein
VRAQMPHAAWAGDPATVRAGLQWPAGLTEDDLRDGRVFRGEIPDAGGLVFTGGDQPAAIAAKCNISDSLFVSAQKARRFVARGCQFPQPDDFVITTALIIDVADGCQPAAVGAEHDCMDTCIMPRHAASAGSAMGGMPMPGGWTMSMTWMRMPGQT